MLCVWTVAASATTRNTGKKEEPNIGEREVHNESGGGEECFKGQKHIEKRSECKPREQAT